MDTIGEDSPFKMFGCKGARGKIENEENDCFSVRDWKNMYVLMEKSWRDGEIG